MSAVNAIFPEFLSHLNICSAGAGGPDGGYRMVQLNLTPEIEVLYMLFVRSLSIVCTTFLKQHV